MGGAARLFVLICMAALAGCKPMAPPAAETATAVVEPWPELPPEMTGLSASDVLARRAAAVMDPARPGAADWFARGCADLAARNADAWQEALDISAGEAMSKRQKAKVIYMPAPPDLQGVEKMLRTSGVLDEVAGEIMWFGVPAWRIERDQAVLAQGASGGSTGGLSQPIEVVAARCGVANAFFEWDNDDRFVPLAGEWVYGRDIRRIVLCYELAQDAVKRGRGLFPL